MDVHLHSLIYLHDVVFNLAVAWLYYYLNTVRPFNLQIQMNYKLF
jgi:hypothetical protein